ncbi:MAG: acetaldehyde dehydrogenase (acetylating) [Anaerolineae bacterium]
MEKVPVVILGSGNIGTDLWYKIRRHPFLTTALMVGIDPNSEGLHRAAQAGCPTTSEGIGYFAEHCPDIADILLDATSAGAHRRHAEVAKALGKRIIDLTPAALGPYVVPSVNLSAHLDAWNINMVTCGGQATVPIVAAVNAAADVRYAEIVSTISSKSAGPGTRQNIDEFTRTTAHALESIGGADRGKAIIILNPAEPPLVMRNTIYMDVAQPDEAKIAEAVQQVVRRVQEYVPGYKLKVPPLLNDGRVTVMLEVTGAGDFLPTYAGNLDIMTSAAVRVAAELAVHLGRGAR